ASPPAEGLNLLVYILPPLAFLGGALVLFRVIQTWRSAKPEVTQVPIANDDPYMARLEAELQERERGD
ncbi:MAG TPA: hypothetical protein VMX56_02115, partial [Anaerolineales bacterium]|nr:hypothetical protein [Anaerolineales bacterium]